MGIVMFSKKPLTPGQVARRIAAEKQRTRGEIHSIVLNTYRRYVPRRSGHMWSMLRVDINVDNRGDEFKVHIPVPYAAFVEYGTGIYGPRGQRIYAKGKAMVWTAPGMHGKIARIVGKVTRNGRAGYIFARSIKGQKGQRFMERAAGDALMRVQIADAVSRMYRRIGEAT
jgi:hypothetical protein